MNRSLSHYKTPLNNRWVHVTATYSGDGTSGDSNTGTLTIDGGFTRNTLSRGYGAPLTPPSTHQRDFIIGGRIREDGRSSNALIPMYLHDFRYYERVLTEQEIAAIYSSSATFGDEKVRLFYQQDEGVVDTYHIDTTIEKHFGLINGGDFVSRDKVVTPALVDWNEQNPDRNVNQDDITDLVAEFNGANNLEIPYTPHLNTLSFAISVWVYPTGQPLIMKQYG